MTLVRRQLIRNSWAQIVPMADQAAALFYERLFEIDPSTRCLFRNADVEQQRKKLLELLGVVVHGLDDLDALSAMLEGLGRRWAGCGVKDRHYEAVGAALLWTLQQGLGPSWTPEVAAAWSEVYALLSAVMRAAQRQAAFDVSSRPAA